MSLANYFPLYSKLPISDREALEQISTFQSARQGTLLHRGGDDCLGLLVVKRGQLRAFMTSARTAEKSPCTACWSRTSACLLPLAL